MTLNVNTQTALVTNNQNEQAANAIIVGNDALAITSILQDLNNSIRDLSNAIRGLQK